MSKLSLFHDRASLMFLPSLCLVLAGGYLTLRSFDSYASHTEWLIHTDEVIVAIKDLRVSIQAAESDERGFLLSKHPELYSSMERSVHQANDDLNRISELTSDNPSQISQVAKLKPLLEKRIAFLEKGIEAKNSSDPHAFDKLIAAVTKDPTHGGPAMMAEVLVDLDQMMDEEMTLRKERSDTLNQQAAKSQRIILISNLIGTILLLIAYVVVNDELKKRKAARLAAEEAFALRSNFLAGMSHELRTPLHSILGMADVLEDASDEMDRRICLTIIKRSSNLLINMINDILDLSKIEVEKLALEVSEFELYPWVEQTVSMIAFRASQKGLMFSFSVDPEAPQKLMADQNRLRQILLNVLGNAIKFTPNGEVNLEITSAESEQGIAMLRFIVRDTGIGISEKKKGEVFNLFNRLDAETVKSYGGTGLGLTISKKLIEKMHGKIGFESEENRGSTFTIDIPEVRPPAKGNAVIESLPDIVPLKILAADDMEDNRLLVQQYLRDMPYQIDFANNGQEAVERFMRVRYDLVILDIHMPIMTGYEAAREIRKFEKDRNLPRTPMMALTALNMKDEIDRSLSAGCDRHVPKPISRPFLKKIIVELTASHQANKGAVVFIKKDLAPLIPKFMENRKDELSKMHVALAARDLTKIDLLAHQLRGVSGTYGFQKLSDLAKRLQGFLKNGNEVDARKCIEQMTEHFDGVEVRYF